MPFPVVHWYDGLATREEPNMVVCGAEHVNVAGITGKVMGGTAISRFTVTCAFAVQLLNGWYAVNV